MKGFIRMVLATSSGSAARSIVVGRIGRSLVIGVLVGATLVACGGSDSSSSSTDSGSTSSSAPSTVAGEVTTTTADPLRSVDITVKAGKVETASSRVSVNKNEQVELRVTSDVAEEVHLHGYDKSVDLTPNEQGTLLFTANIPGVFEVELEKSHKKLIDLEVKG